MKRKLRVLIVDDSEDDAESMALMLESANGFEVDYVRVDTEAAMLNILENQPIDIVWLDFNMPHFSAPQALKIKREKNIDIHFVLMSGYVDKKTANEMIQQGARAYVDKGIMAEMVPLVTELMDASDQRDEFIAAMGVAVELKDWETEGHSQRVTQLTIKLARAMEIPYTEIKHIERGALLHDVGKIWVSDSVLLKRGLLTPGERTVMEEHVTKGYNFLKKMSWLDRALPIPYSHHEKWDGTGYPRGLKGESIPRDARIFSVVDVYDAISTSRPYREAIEKERALAYIESEAGRSFDPQVVEAFIEMMRAE